MTRQIDSYNVFKIVKGESVYIGKLTMELVEQRFVTTFHADDLIYPSIKQKVFEDYATGFSSLSSEYDSEIFLNSQIKQKINDLLGESFDLGFTLSN